MISEEKFEKTPLFDRHRILNARMGPFGGYWMPIQYKGILSEHAAVRNQSAIFDTCHMGEFIVSGPSAFEFLEKIISSDLASMSEGQCRYGLMCNPEGGILDDLVVYRLAENEFMLVVNAATRDGDYKWIDAHITGSVALRDISKETSKVDLQGPEAPKVLQALLDRSIENMKYYAFRRNRFMDRAVLVSRTGYTGEIGFEIYADPDTAKMFWDACLEKGVAAAGLGARNTLRLEMGLPLYGHELSPERNAAESGLKRFISESKDFIGSSAIRKAGGGDNRLVGLVFDGRQTARDGERILSLEEDSIGIITSGSFAPSLGHAVALGYIDGASASPGTEVNVSGRRPLRAKVWKPPFYSKGTARKPLESFMAN